MVYLGRCILQFKISKVYHIRSTEFKKFEASIFCLSLVPQIIKG